MNEKTMNKALLQLKKEFGKYGSWALWNHDGSITSLIQKDDFENKIKLNIVFVGLNASKKLQNLPDWVNFHSECAEYFKPTWKMTHARKLAEVLQEPEFEPLKGAYITDIIKNHYDADSGVVVNKIKQYKDLVSENAELFKNELRMLSKIFGSDNFYIIGIGHRSFEILNRISEYQTFEIWHYSAYQLGWEGVKVRIRQDLRKIIKNWKRK